MKSDEKRAVEHPVAFWIGMGAMIAVIILTAIALYVFPHFYLGLHYDVHENISHFLEWAERTFNLERAKLINRLYLFLIFLILLFSWIGKKANHFIERDILPRPAEIDKETEIEQQESLVEERQRFWSFTLKVIAVMLLGILCVVVFNLLFII